MKLLIVIPAYNEEKILVSTIARLYDFCQKNLSLDWEIVIANNQSTDQTGSISDNLALNYPLVKHLLVSKKGKGAAIMTAWQQFFADIYCFMDADLATDLSALPALISGIKDGNDLVVGSRFHPDSKVARSFGRKMFSNAYRLVLKIILNLKVKDIPCGFKAINQKVKTDLLPQIQDQEWFFDSELLILAEKQGYQILEIPVIWAEPRKDADKSRVKPLSLGLAYFKKVFALKKRLKN